MFVTVQASGDMYVKQMHLTHVKFIHMQCVHLYIAQSNAPDLAIQGFADGDCSGDVVIPRPRHHNLCVALTRIAVLHLHRQTCSTLGVTCVSMSLQCGGTYMLLHITCTDRLTGLTWCCISPAQADVHHFVLVGSNINFFLMLADVSCSSGNQL